MSNEIGGLLANIDKLQQSVAAAKDSLTTPPTHPTSKGVDAVLKSLDDAVLGVRTIGMVVMRELRVDEEKQKAAEIAAKAVSEQATEPEDPNLPT